MPATPNQTAHSRAVIKYAQAHLRQYVFRCHKDYDADLIGFLDSMDNRQGEIKRILRAEIARIEAEGGDHAR